VLWCFARQRNTCSVCSDGLAIRSGSASSSSGTLISTGSRCGCGREIGPRCRGSQIAPLMWNCCRLEGRSGNWAALRLLQARSSVYWLTSRFWLRPPRYHPF
jgi:hypothetical protein